MALVEPTLRANTQFLTISDGWIVYRSKTASEGFVTRVTAKGHTVHEKRYEALQGRLLSITRRETDWGLQWELKMVDEQDHYTLTLPYESSYAKQIINRLAYHAVDFSKPITLRPYSFIDKTTQKQKKGVRVEQDGLALPWAFSIEDMPSMEQITVKGKLTWDDTKQLEFFENVVATKIQPLLASSIPF